VPVKGSYLAIVGAGGILLWSGLRGKKWSDVVRQVIAGKSPATTTTSYQLTSNINTAGGVTNISNVPVPRGPVLPQAAIGTLWIAMGGAPSKARVAMCIAMHESGGRVGVTSRNPDGGTNVGLYQLDTPGGKGAGYSVAQLQNPATNTRVAIRASANGTDWSAWATAPMCGV